MAVDTWSGYKLSVTVFMASIRSRQRWSASSVSLSQFFIPLQLHLVIVAVCVKQRPVANCLIMRWGKTFMLLSYSYSFILIFFSLFPVSSFILLSVSLSFPACLTLVAFCLCVCWLLTLSQLMSQTWLEPSFLVIHALSERVRWARVFDLLRTSSSFTFIVLI